MLGALEVASEDDVFLGVFEATVAELSFAMWLSAVLTCEVAGGPLAITAARAL